MSGKSDSMNIKEKIPLKDLVHYTETTNNQDDILGFLKHPNLVISMAIAKNPNLSDAQLRTLGLQHLNVPPLLEIIAKNPVCSKETGKIISWELYNLEKEQKKLLSIRMVSIR